MSYCPSASKHRSSRTRPQWKRTICTTPSNGSPASGTTSRDSPSPDPFRSDPDPTQGHCKVTFFVPRSNQPSQPTKALQPDQASPAPDQPLQSLLSNSYTVQHLAIANPTHPSDDPIRVAIPQKKRAIAPQAEDPDRHGSLDTPAQPKPSDRLRYNRAKSPYSYGITLS